MAKKKVKSAAQEDSGPYIFLVASARALPGAWGRAKTEQGALTIAIEESGERKATFLNYNVYLVEPTTYIDDMGCLCSLPGKHPILLKQVRDGHEQELEIVLRHIDRSNHG